MSNPIALLLLPLLAAQLVMPAASACPAGMTQVGAQPWCVKYYNNEVTFCDAVKTCHENGQEMISKPVHDAMKASSIPGGNRWWVGLVDALNERGTSEDGWVWIKDGQVTQSGGGDFYSSQPDNYGGDQDCATVRTPSDKLLRDETCSDLHSVYCYADDSVANRIATKSNTGKFEQVEIADRQQPDPGCWIKEPSARTHFDCSRACLQFQFGDCVGFYWHTVRRQCVLLPYFDASVPLDGTDFSADGQEKLQWMKYLRME